MNYEKSKTYNLSSNDCVPYDTDHAFLCCHTFKTKNLHIFTDI